MMTDLLIFSVSPFTSQKCPNKNPCGNLFARPQSLASVWKLAIVTQSTARINHAQKIVKDKTWFN